MDRVTRILEVRVEGVWDSVKLPVMDRPVHCVHTNEIGFRLDTSDRLMARGTYEHPSQVSGLKAVLSHHQLFLSLLRGQPYEGQEQLWEKHTRVHKLLPPQKLAHPNAHKELQ